MAASVAICGGGQRKEMSETPECHRMWTMLDSTNSGMKKEAENEFLSGMAASVAICRGGQRKENIRDTGMPPDADNIGLDN
jgi:hypothetical protein